ncbi:MAG: hypothetical protein ACE5SW_08355 [Nitrososphaeraceae archaeon]
MRNMFLAENFLRSIIFKYSKHFVYTDGGTWCPQTCNILHLKDKSHSLFEKGQIERVMEDFKDGTEDFDDYHPFRRREV